MNRLESLDWLRGLLALSIMVYHLTCWTSHEPDASTLLGRLGIYGVSMFFILSGLSMAAAYSQFIRDGRTSWLFFVRRLFRIWPLLWVAVVVATLGGVIVKGQAVDWGLVLLNLTTLFGFVDPGAYINTGAWSIGNEMVYYALTPLLLASFNRSRFAGNVVVALTLVVALVFAFEALTTEATLASQWKIYIHPLNNLGFYGAGIAVYFNTQNSKFDGRMTALLLLGSVLTFSAFPVDGDLIATVTGVPRIAFFFASMGLVVAFFKMQVEPPPWLTRPLATLGVATYGVYLLHPIVYQSLALLLEGLKDSSTLLMISTIVVTTAVATASYRWFEAPLIRLGKKLTTTKASLPAATP